MTEPFPNIVCTEDVLAGSPRIKDRRLAVGDVVDLTSNYGTLEKIQKDYELTISEIKQALQYCSSLQCKQDNPKVFCHNCSLSREQEGPLDTSNLEEISKDDDVYVQGDNSIYLGSMTELLEEWQGKNLWIRSADLLIDLRNELKA